MSDVHFAANAVVNLVNVLFFVVVQTIFFLWIASKEVDRVVREKSRIAFVLRQQLQRNCLDRGVSMVDWQMHGVGEQAAQADPQRLAAERTKDNHRLILHWIGPVVLTLAVVLGALAAFLIVKKHSFPLSHRVGLALVVVAYVVEILIFVFVIERYTMVGDYELVQMALGGGVAD